MAEAVCNCLMALMRDQVWLMTEVWEHLWGILCHVARHRACPWSKVLLSCRSSMATKFFVQLPEVNSWSLPEGICLVLDLASVHP